MKNANRKIIQKRKHLYKILESFTEEDLYVIKSFAEFLKQAKVNGDDIFLQRLINSDYEKEELNEKTINEIKRAKSEVRKKKYSTLDKVMKEFGL